jgi:hypothetical protein
MKPRVGTTLKSTTDDTTVVVVRWGGAEGDLTCGGAPMVDARGPESQTVHEADPAQQAGTQMGKRYVHDDNGVELLCTKAGSGTVALDGTPLLLKGAAPLPSSD